MVRRDLVPATAVKDRRMVESVRVARAAHAMIDREVNVHVARGKVEGRVIARHGQLRAPNDLRIVRKGHVVMVVHKKKYVGRIGHADQAKAAAQQGWNVQHHLKNGPIAKVLDAAIALPPSEQENAHRSSYAMVDHRAAHPAPMVMRAPNVVPKADPNALDLHVTSAATASVMPARNAL